MKLCTIDRFDLVRDKPLRGTRVRFFQLCSWSRSAVQKSCVVSCLSRLPCLPLLVKQPSLLKGESLQSPLRRRTRSQAHPTRELRSQPPRPCSRPQTHTQPALCGLWVNQPLKHVILLSIPFYSVWLRFCHPACSNTYECKKMYLYKGLRKVTEYSSMAFTNAEESTSRAGSDEWMKPAVKHACRSGTRGAHKHPTVVINDQALWTKKNSLHLASR